jgi:hypothetical protein
MSPIPPGGRLTVQDRWRSIAWLVVAGTVVTALFGVVIGSAPLVGESTSVALLVLGALVAGGWAGPRVGRMLAGSGLGVLALDAHLSAQWSAPIVPLDAADQVEWVWQALAAQVQTHGLILLGVPLLAAGIVLIARARPADGRRWWAGVVALIVAIAGVVVPAALLAWQEGIAAVAARLPILVLVGPAIVLPVAADRRGWRVAVPATAGAVLLAVAVLTADIFSVAPPPPLEPTSGSFLAPGLMYSVSVSAGHFSGQPGLFGAPLPALATLSAMLVLALIPLGRRGSPR